MRLHRGLLAAGLLLPAIAGLTAPATAAPDGPYRVQLLYRVGASLAPFDVTLTGSGATHAYSFWTIVELRRTGAGWRQGDSVARVAAGGSAGPVAYGVPGAPGACPHGPGCSYPDVAGAGGSGATFRGLRPQATSRYYVISAYGDVAVAPASAAWRVKDVPAAGVRRVLADHSPGSAGVGALGEHAERFTGASAPGGRYGSAVFAALPCEGGGVGRAVLSGRGALDISGQMPPLQPECTPTGRVGGFTWAYSPLPTTWRLTGEATGVGYGLTRLFVFDFPRP